MPSSSELVNSATPCAASSGVKTPGEWPVPSRQITGQTFIDLAERRTALARPPADRWNRPLRCPQALGPCISGEASRPLRTEAGRTCQPPAARCLETMVDREDQKGRQRSGPPGDPARPAERRRGRIIDDRRRIERWDRDDADGHSRRNAGDVMRDSEGSNAAIATGGKTASPACVGRRR